MIFVILYFLADSTDRAGDGSQIAFAVLMPDCLKDLLLCKQFARMLCHQTQNTVFITTHVHLCSVFENTVVFQVDLQTGAFQSFCGIPHQIEPFKNRLFLRWAVILRDANNNFNITRYGKSGVARISALTVHYDAVCFNIAVIESKTGQRLAFAATGRWARIAADSPQQSSSCTQESPRSTPAEA